MHQIFSWFRKYLKFRKLYLTIFSSIAFLPSIIAFGIVLLSILFMYLDSLRLSYELVEYIPFVITHNPETARNLLSTLAAGMISLMVFSFTMVMVVLTMATNNYTPRVLPGIINNRSHQIVLGLYLGTIVFTLVVLINTESERYKFQVPELSVLMSAVLVLTCFIAFIYFIHSISQDIQIGNILANLFTDTRKSLFKELEMEFAEKPDNSDGWRTISSTKAGYFQGINDAMSIQIASDYNVQMMVMVENGKFLLEGAPFMKISENLPDPVIKKLQYQVSYYHQEHVEVNYLYGYKHITEIAVKALSPGINDPGTAIKAIEYLTQLFLYHLSVGAYRVRRDDHDIPRLFYAQVSFEMVFYVSFSSIRNYATKDVAVQEKLLILLNELESSEKGSKFKTLFQQERNALIKNAAAGLDNQKDLFVLRNHDRK